MLVVILDKTSAVSQTILISLRASIWRVFSQTWRRRISWIDGWRRVSAVTGKIFGRRISTVWWRRVSRICVSFSFCLSSLPPGHFFVWILIIIRLFVDYSTIVSFGCWIIPRRSVVVITMDRASRNASSKIVHIILIILLQPAINVAMPLQLVKIGSSINSLVLARNLCRVSEIIWALSGLSIGNAFSHC